MTPRETLQSIIEPSELAVKLAGIVELGVVSIGTTKRVLREIRGQTPKVKTVRPTGMGTGAMYVQPGTSKSALSMISDMHGTKIKPGTVVVPRMNKDIRGGMAEGRRMSEEMVAAEAPRLKRVMQRGHDNLEKISDPIGMGLHEHGHATIPKSTSIALMNAQKKGQVPFTDPFWKTSIDEEYRANRDILSRIKKHGTPAEAEAWKQRSQMQIKSGYRNQIFNGIAQTEATKKEMNKAMKNMALPMSLKRRVVEKYPHLRRQEMSAQEELDSIIQLGYSNDFLSSAASGAGLVAGVGGAYAAHNAIQNRGGYNAVRKKTWQASKDWLKKVGKKIKLSARDELIELAGGYVNTEDGIKREKGGHLKRHAATYIASLPLTPLAGIPVGAVIDAIRRRGNKKKTALEPTIPRDLEPAMALMSAREELDLILFAKKGGDYKRHWSQKKTDKKGKKKCPDCGESPCECHTYSARDQLNTILMGVDVRPRDPMGRFDQAEDGAPNPQHMKITYGGLAAGAAGGAAFQGGGMGLKALVEKLKAVKKK